MSPLFIIPIIVGLSLILPALFAIKKHDATTEDYVTAKRSIGWLPAGVSAGVSMLSGFSFTALVGYSYIFGAFAIWFVVIRNIGEIAISWYVWPKLYNASIKHRCVTLGQLVDKIYGGNIKTIRFLSGLTIVFLLTLYIASQLQSASIALEHTMQIIPDITIISAGIILMAYCFWGGVRSSIWTDNSQAVFMAFTLISIPVGIIASADSVQSIYQSIIAHSDTNYLNPFNHPNIPHEKLYIFSLLFIGFCILGQPHIFSRFITVDSEKNMKKAQLTYYGTALSMNLMAVLIGIMIRGIIPPEIFTDAQGNINAESALFSAALLLFPLWFVYIIAAGGASAAMSTSDSQIQAASTALIVDVIRPIRTAKLKKAFSIRNDWTHHHLATKAGTALIIIISTALALGLTKQTVFDIVEVSWSTQGSFFFTLFVAYLINKKVLYLSETKLMTVIFIAVAGTLTWKFCGLNHIAYPAMVGMTLSFISIFVFKRYSYPK